MITLQTWARMVVDAKLDALNPGLAGALSWT